MKFLAWLEDWGNGLEGLVIKMIAEAVKSYSVHQPAVVF